MQDPNQNAGLFNLRKQISGNLTGDTTLPQLNLRPLGQDDRTNRKTSLEVDLVKVEEPEQYFSKGRPISESNLLDSKSTLDTQNFSNVNSRTSLNQHINNLSMALQKYQIETPNLTQSASLNTLDSQPLGQGFGLNRPIFGQQPLFSNNYPQQINNFQFNFGSLPYQSNSYSNVAANKHQFYQNLNNQHYSLQNLPQQNQVAPFANLKRFSLPNQMAGINQPHMIQQPTPQLTPQQQQKVLAYQNQKEVQKKQLQSKMEALMQLEKKIEDSKQKKTSLHKSKLTAEGSDRAMSLSECSESFSTPIKQEHLEQLCPSYSGASMKTFEEQKSFVGICSKDAIDIEEDLQRNPSRQMESAAQMGPSSFTSLDEELITNAGFSGKIANLPGNQYSSIAMNATDSDKTSIKDSLCSIKSMPDVVNECTHNDGNNIRATETLQMIEEKGDEENAETPINKTSITPGIYSREERMEKILRYKKKIMKWRLAHPPNRNFLGRSFVAGSKPRIKGKFVSREEYDKHVTMERRIQFMNMLPRTFPIFNGFGMNNEDR